MKKDQLKKRSQHKDYLTKEPPQQKQVKAKKNYDLVGLAIIILLGIIIYSNSFKCSFHFDDFFFIVDNTKIRNLADVKTWWSYAPNRPVGYFTFVLNYHFNQLDVRYWHLVNLVIHLINACLVWWLTILIFSSPVMKDQPVSRHKHMIAFLTAILFVSHPLATQSVTYIYQRLASLAAMFYFLALALYLKARYSNKGNVSKILLFAGSVISVAAAMLTKENAFTLPLAMALLELFFIHTKGFSINFRNYRIILLITVFLSIIIILPLRFSLSIFKSIPPANGNAYSITPLNYLFTQFSVIVKYIQLLFLPIKQNVDYDFPISNNFFELRTLFSFLGLLSLIILGFFLFKKYRIISFGIFWFFLTLSIESGFIPISDVIFEHRTYLPSFGFFLIFSTVIYGLLGNRYKVLALVIMVIIIIVNSYLTYDRNKVWKDNLSLWSDVVSKSPHKTRSIVSLGFSYGNIGQWGYAITEYSRAIEINPEYYLTYYNRGVAYDNIEQWNKAITDYSKVIGMVPNYLNAYFNRGIAYWNLGQWENAIADYSKAIEINPNFSDAYSNRGIAYNKVGQWDKAIADYSRAIAINPEFANAYSNRGVVYDNLRQWDNAIADYTSAIAIDPKYTVAYFNRGTAYLNCGQYDKAIGDFTKTIALDPDFKKAYSNREIANSKLHMKKD